MSQRDEHWEHEDEEVVGRLRAGRPRLTDFELDRVKTTVMARLRRPTGRRAAPRTRLLVAVVTVGLMAVGTAGTIAGGNTSFSGGTGAAESQYRPPKCNPHHEECKCPDHSIRVGRDKCVCPDGQTFAPGKNDCRCPDGSTTTRDRKCTICPDGRELKKSGRCERKRHHDESSSQVSPQSAPPTSSSLQHSTSVTAGQAGRRRTHHRRSKHHHRRAR
jgi:hypothetical protein